MRAHHRLGTVRLRGLVKRLRVLSRRLTFLFPSQRQHGALLGGGRAVGRQRCRQYSVREADDDGTASKLDGTATHAPSLWCSLSATAPRLGRSCRTMLIKS